MSSYGNFGVFEDTIFVTGLPEETTEAQLSEYFGQIGVIKFDKKNNCPKIWVYKDKASGKGKGEATITYDDPPSATSAISWFNGKEFEGKPLKVELAQRKTAPPTFSRGGGAGGPRHDSRGAGGGGYDRGGGERPVRPGRPGDWPCPSCSNNNFAYRNECNRCGASKPYNAAAPRPERNYNNPHQHGPPRGGGGGGGSSYRDRDRDRDRDRHRDRDRDGGRGGHYDRGGGGGSGRGDGGGGGGGLRARDRSRDGRPSSGNYTSEGGRRARA